MIEDIYPLSPMQQGILFHTLEQPGAGLYVAQFCARLDGTPKEVSFLRRAWEQVITRHSSLRTSFIWEGVAEPVQVVEFPMEVPWKETDWRALSDEEKVIALETYREQERTRPFDIGRAPLMRLALIRTGEQQFEVIWSLHHLLLDGWSLLLVLGEVLSFYEGHCTGKPMYLPRPRFYSDYIAWLQRQDCKRGELFWREALKGSSGFTWPGTQRCLGPTNAAEKLFARRTKRLTSEDTVRLERVARQHRIALNTVIQATWGILLSCYSGQNDVMFGATTAGRPVDLPGAEHIAGLLINTLPVRFRLQDPKTILDCLRSLQREQSEARQFEYIPLVRIHDWSGIQPTLPLFQSILVFDSYPNSETLWARAGRMRLYPSKIERPSSNYAMTATVSREPDLVLDLTFLASQFSMTNAEQMLENWHLLLKCISDDITLPLRIAIEKVVHRSRSDEKLLLKSDLRSKLKGVRRASISC